MVHIFLLVSLFTQMNFPMEGQDKDPQASVAQLEGINKTNSFVEVRFNKTPHVTVGDPVIFNGNVVGSISRVDLPAENKGATNVSIRLLQEELPINESLVALVGSVKMGSDISIGKNNKGKSSTNRSFLELMSFKAGANNDSSYVKGFTSFQEFWASQSVI